MIFPWRPSQATGLAIIITRRETGFSVKPLMASYFIPCVGAPDAEECQKIPGIPAKRGRRGRCG